MAKEKITDNPTLIDRTINELGKKYLIHDFTQWNHDDRLKMFLNDIKGRIKKINYEIEPKK